VLRSVLTPSPEGTDPRGGRRSLTVLLALTALSACLLLTGSSAQAATCPNEALREAQGATALPDCMALEMVSPPKKYGQTAYVPSFSADGERVLYLAQAALADTPGFQFFAGDRYIASRTATGWQSAPTAPLLPDIQAGGSYGGNPSAFTPDLSRWVQLGTTQSQSYVGIYRLYEGGLDGSFNPVSPLIVPFDDSGEQGIQFSSQVVTANGASADLTTTVIQGMSPQNAYLPGDPRTNAQNEPGNDRNSYVVFLDEGEPTLELMARDKDGEVWGGRCGAHLGGPRGVSLSSGTFIQGAISPDGQRLYFSTRPAQSWDSEKAEGPVCNDTQNPTRIMVRTTTEAGPVIEPLLPGGQSEWEEPGEDLYEGASLDGTTLYFTSPRDVAASDLDPGSTKCSADLSPQPGSGEGCDLYLYDFAKPPAQRLTQVSAGEAGSPTPGQGAEVLSSITAISRDGSPAYSVAQGVLTTDPNSEGVTAQAGEPNLYLYEADTEDTAFIGTLADEDQGGMWGVQGSFMGDAYAAEDVLAFASKAPLTEDDEDNSKRDVFRYDAGAGTLERISKATEGGSDDGAYDVTVNPNVGKIPESNFGEQSRWVSEDGQAIAFATEEALIPTDENGARNPYLWTSGELGAAPAPVKDPPAISPDGDAFAFSTKAALLPTDGDTAEDV
jgi:WD40-like Beta Propeller Repeat